MTDISKDSIVKGLKEAVFDQDYSRLEIRIPLETWGTGDFSKATTDILYVQGHAKGGFFSTIAQKSGSSYVQKSDKFYNFSVLGTLEYEEPKVAKCLELANDQRSFSIGTAKILEKGRRVGFGTSNGPEMNACHTTLTDTNVLVGESSGKAIVVLSDDKDLAKQVSYVGGAGHHGSCRFWRIETPWAIYAARGAPEAGTADCKSYPAPAPVPDAPGEKVIYKKNTVTPARVPAK